MSICVYLFVLLSKLSKLMSDLLKDIIVQGKSANASHKQKQEFAVLFHQPEMEFEVKKHLLDDLNSTLDSDKDKLYFDELFETIWKNHRISSSVGQSPKRWIIRVGRWAAILVLGLILGYLLQISQGKDNDIYYTSVSPRGSISELILPDGSHIFLNSGSEIRYSVAGNDNKREVFLTGEAWFQVAKMEEKPFVVHTSIYDVNVTGTEFNVKAYPEENEVTTTLEKGTVIVSSSENVKLSDNLILKPGEQLVYDKNLQKSEIAKVNPSWFTSWKDNKLVFVNMSLNDLKILLERKFGVDIEIKDQQILKYHYDGTLKDETILEVLDILKNTLPIQYHIVGQKIIIQKK